MRPGARAGGFASGLPLSADGRCDLLEAPSLPAQGRFHDHHQADAEQRQADEAAGDDVGQLGAEDGRVADPAPPEDQGDDPGRGDEGAGGAAAVSESDHDTGQARSPPPAPAMPTKDMSAAAAARKP